MTTATATRSPERETFLAEVLTTAVEGGVNYWAAIEDYRWYYPDLEGGTAEPAPNGGGNAHATVFDAEDDEDQGEHVDLDSIAGAVNRIVNDEEVRYLSKNTRRIVKVANRQNTVAPDQGDDIDAQVADEVLQVAAYGEVVFG